jgi:hypothetical protein
VIFIYHYLIGNTTHLCHVYSHQNTFYTQTKTVVVQSPAATISTRMTSSVKVAPLRFLISMIHLNLLVDKPAANSRFVVVNHLQPALQFGQQLAEKLSSNSKLIDSRTVEPYIELTK